MMSLERKSLLLASFKNAHFYFQGHSISQWWNWQTSTEIGRNPHNNHKKIVVGRSNSLKEKSPDGNKNRQNPDEAEGDDEVFVTADPVQR